MVIRSDFLYNSFGVKKPPLHSIYPIKELRDLLIQVTGRYGDPVALQSKKNGTYQPLTYSQLFERVAELATAFAEFGLKKGDGCSHAVGKSNRMGRDLPGSGHSGFGRCAR